MEFLMELVLEIILEGCVEAATEKRVPLPIRILLAVILAVFCIGVFGLLIYLGIKIDSILVKILIAGIMVLLIVGIIKKIKGFGKHNS